MLDVREGSKKEGAIIANQESAFPSEDEDPHIAM